MSSQRITYLEDEHKKKMIHLIYQQYLPPSRTCVEFVVNSDSRPRPRSPVPYTEVLNLTFKCLRKDMRALRLHARYQIFYGSNAKVSGLRSATARHATQRAQRSLTEVVVVAMGDGMCGAHRAHPADARGRSQALFVGADGLIQPSQALFPRHASLSPLVPLLLLPVPPSF